eukprot:TRINITY_DN1705_c0_g2_i1.p1 TRINITY_DN1705_c0_g2~~TRINITY_DN1705_c0_g2_i1.p1  ORF type:complete len:1309 (-),score=346.84 TRINITY_DN1705_c0_g2_i1:47-3835(-)
MAFSPDGTQVVLAAGTSIALYDMSPDSAGGDHMRFFKGHKGNVYCVAFEPTGERFASGGSDMSVIIWSTAANNAAGNLRYPHNDAVQALAFNPTTKQLLSCAVSDFGIWSPDLKSVPKTRVSSKILCCSYTPDGNFMALGHYAGVISIRDREGVEKVKIERNAPVWCLQWNPSSEEKAPILAAGDWDQKLAFYQMSGRPARSDRALGFDPCSVGYFSNGEYLCVAGSDKKLHLFTKEGVFLTTFGDIPNWAWCVRHQPGKNAVAVSDNSGQVTCYQLHSNVIHTLYKDLYAYRHLMSDVVIQHLLTDKKFEIHCHDYVKMVALYRTRLAVQLPGQVILYDLHIDEETQEITPDLRWRINKYFNCNFLVVVSNHLIPCEDKKISLYNFKGVKEREWVLESWVRFVKLVGGPPGKESLIMALKSNVVVQIFIDNPFPIPLVKTERAIRCLDLSASRKKLAVVDENNECLVFDLETKQILYREPNATSVAWNAEFDDMLCYGGQGTLNVKVASFPVSQQRIPGHVVGFSGSKVYSLHSYTMHVTDMPQSASLYRYLQQKDFDKAYVIACLGVTEKDWRLLGMEALRALNIPIARKCFIRVRDLAYIELCQRYDVAKQHPNFNEMCFLGDVAAFDGQFQEAAEYYIKSGNPKKAIEMYSDLQMWEEAKAIATALGNPQLLQEPVPQTPRKKGTKKKLPTKTGAPATPEPATPSPAGKAESRTKEATATKGKKSAAPRAGIRGSESIGALSSLLAGAEKQGAAGMQHQIDISALMRNQAEINEKDKNWKDAAAIYSQIGDFSKAVEIYGEREMVDLLHDLTQTLDKKEAAALTKAAQYFIKMKKSQFASEVFVKIGDREGLVKLLTEQCEWEKAIALVRAHQELGEHVYVPYANWLAINDQFEKAQRILIAAGKPEAALKVLEHLSHNAVLQERYDDASYFMWQLSAAHTKMLTHTPDQFTAVDEQHWRQCQRLREASEIYFAYQFVHSYMVHPFTSLHPEVLFSVSRWLLNTLQTATSIPYRVRKHFILYTLAVQSKHVGAFKLSRQSYEQLQQQYIPPTWLDKVDLGSLMIRAKPFSDNEELQPLCARCSTGNPLVSKHGHRCASCTHPFVYSFWAFENLSIVEFELEDGLTDEDARKYIDADPSNHQEQQQQSKNVHSLDLDAGDSFDAFSQLLQKYEQGNAKGPLKLNRAVLEKLPSSEVFIATWSSPYMKTQYYKTVLPEEHVVMCHGCNHFFMEDDFELLIIQKGFCPFCHTPASGPTTAV